MASWYILGLLLCVSLANVNSTNLQVGNLSGELIHMARVHLSSFPLKVRTKTFWYNVNDDNSLKTIRGISAIDLNNTKGTAIVTAGGINSTYVNMRLKSQRGKAIDYQIQIYV